jgi:protein-arginine kinase activator protein McsA
MQAQAARLDTATGDVVCVECGFTIKNITVFAKNQLKSFGQTTKQAKKQEPYSIKCEHCGMTAKPVLANDILACSSCHKELTNISAPFKIMLKNVLGNESK